MNKNIPAVSVVIPMYNTEKFIGACLESLLNQIFKAFEVLVVDHCSTDNSAKVVESYVQKFAGGGQELRLVRLKVNVGNPYAPRNKGLNLSRGKYVYFMDSDDLLLNEALQVLYNFAEAGAADVVHMYKYFKFDTGSEKPFPTEVTVVSELRGKPAPEPEMETENMAERIIDFLRQKFYVLPWLKFSRRDFLIENEVYFPKVDLSEDDFWTMKLICRAKRIVCIPHILYIYRVNHKIFTPEQKQPAKTIKSQMGIVMQGMEFLRELFREQEFFQRHPEYWYALVDWVFTIRFNIMFPSCENLQPYEIFEIIRGGFADELGEHAELIAALCAMVNIQQKRFHFANERRVELEQKLAKLEA